MGGKKQEQLYGLEMAGAQLERLSRLHSLKNHGSERIPVCRGERSSKGSFSTSLKRRRRRRRRRQQKQPAGLVSARAVEDICQIFTWSMMTNVRCVTVFCIDVKGLLQHVVHENDSKIVAILTSKCCETVVSCQKKARKFILQHHHHSLWDNF